MEHQGTEISFLCNQFPFLTGFWSLYGQGRRGFPVYIGFHYVLVPFNTGFNAIISMMHVIVSWVTKRSEHWLKVGPFRCKEYRNSKIENLFVLWSVLRNIIIEAVVQDGLWGLNSCAIKAKQGIKKKRCRWNCYVVELSYLWNSWWWQRMLLVCTLKCNKQLVSCLDCRRNWRRCWCQD